MSKIIQFRRKREGKTDYKRRLKLLISNKLRIVIRRSLKNISIQLVEYHPEGDKVLVTAHSSELRKKGWKLNTGNVPAAYLTGILFGEKIKKEKKEKKEITILDIGLNPSIKGVRIYAALKGIKESSINIKCDEKVFPSLERINGKHIQDYIELLKKNDGKFKKQFSNYIKSDMINNIINEVKEIRKKIIEK